MKRKITAISLVIALVAIAVVGGSLAWFSDTDEATNVFTIGSVEIEQIEQQRVVDASGAVTGDLEAFANDKQLIPAIDNTNGTADPNFEDKIVTVKNKGKNAAWVQTFVAVPKVLNDAGILHVHTNQGQAGYGWAAPVAVGTVTEDALVTGGSATLEYTVYKFLYNTTLAAGATTDALMNGVYLDQATDMNVTFAADGVTVETAYFVAPDGTEITGFDANGKVNVFVATQAVQADGFASAEVGLDAAFATHPWA